MRLTVILADPRIRVEDIAVDHDAAALAEEFDDGIALLAECRHVDKERLRLAVLPLCLHLRRDRERRVACPRLVCLDLGCLCQSAKK